MSSPPASRSFPQMPTSRCLQPLFTLPLSYEHSKGRKRSEEQVSFQINTLPTSLPPSLSLSLCFSLTHTYAQRQRKREERERLITGKMKNGIVCISTNECRGFHLGHLKKNNFHITLLIHFSFNFIYIVLYWKEKRYRIHQDAQLFNRSYLTLYILTQTRTNNCSHELSEPFSCTALLLNQI